MLNLISKTNSVLAAGRLGATESMSGSKVAWNVARVGRALQSYLQSSTSKLLLWPALAT